MVISRRISLSYILSSCFTPTAFSPAAQGRRSWWLDWVLCPASNTTPTGSRRGSKRDQEHSVADPCGAACPFGAAKSRPAGKRPLLNSIIHGNLEVESALKEQGPDCFAAMLAKQASDEALSSRSVDILVDFDGEVCHWVITDEGKGFDVERIVNRCGAQISWAVRSSATGTGGLGGLGVSEQLLQVIDELGALDQFLLALVTE